MMGSVCSQSKFNINSEDVRLEPLLFFTCEEWRCSQEMRNLLGVGIVFNICNLERDLLNRAAYQDAIVVFKRTKRSTALLLNH